MTKPAKSYWQRFMRLAAGAITAAMAASASFVSPLSLTSASAASGDRTLYLYYTHTRETAKITFKRNGRYDQKGLAELNRFLRDWRRNEPTKMDPALFDLVWEVYQEAGSDKPIYVVSAYRAPATNEMLRATSSGVAKNSRHTMGMAMDFFIPGVPISKLRAIAMKKQIGGVGYYPSSGSPFVHLDTGNVRAWPRMTKAQLQKLFPEGKTLHLPTNGVPLSKSGYQYAKAEWTKCHSVPCRGSSFGATTRLAGNSAGDDGKPKQTLVGWLFGDEENEGAEEAAVTAVASSSARAATSGRPPVPHDRPLLAGMTVAYAPVPAPRPAAYDGDNAVAAIAENTAPIPHMPADSSILTAYAPPRAASMAGVQAASATTAPDGKDMITTAALTGGNPPDALGALIESTWTAVEDAGTRQAALAAAAGIQTRYRVFQAPDFEHVAEIFIDPQPMNGDRYAVIFEHDEADFSPAAELGRHIVKAGLKNDAAWGLGIGRFAPRAPLLVAAR